MAKGGVVGTIASVAAAPITAPLAIAKAVAPDAVSSVESKLQGVPVVGTLVNGAEGASNIGPDLISGGPVGNDLAATGKAAAVIGAGAAGGLAAGVVVNQVVSGGAAISPSGLLNLAGDYFGGQSFAPEDLFDVVKPITPVKSGGGGAAPAVPGGGGTAPKLPGSGQELSPVVPLALLASIVIIGKRF